MKLYLKYLGIHIRSQMQYKTSFALAMFGQMLTSLSVFLGVYFMFARFNRVADYGYGEILLCFALVLFSFSIAECFFRGFDLFPSIILSGELDRIMLRPRNEIFQVVCAKIELSRLGRMLQALVMFCYALPRCDVIWNLSKILTLALMILGGVLIFCALFIVYAGICFFTVEGLEFMNIFTDGSREFGTYPLSIYGDSLLKFYTYVIPIACFQYYPLLYLTGRSSNPLYAFTPLAGVVFLLPCLLFWRVGVKRYTSVGS